MTQAANRLVIDLDRAGRAEMPYISGTGDGVRVLVKTARSGRPTLTLNGCVLAYVGACLATVSMTPDVHLVLDRCGAKERYHAGCSDDGLNVAAALVDDAVNTLEHRPGTAGDWPASSFCCYPAMS